jgi:hypothetical protein
VQLHYTGGKGLVGYPSEKWLGDSWSLSGRFRKENNLLPQLGIESRLHGCRAFSLVTIATEVRWSVSPVGFAISDAICRRPPAAAILVGGWVCFGGLVW